MAYPQGIYEKKNYIHKSDIKSYETERLIRANKTALSNILIASMAAEHPEIYYISLGDLSIEKAR